MSAKTLKQLCTDETYNLEDKFYPAAEVRALVEAAAELVGAGQSHIESTQFCVIYERAAKVRTALAALGGGE